MFDIHISWEGPFTLEEALKLNGDCDRGLYQYYGDHPVYGSGVLLYLGEAAKQTFAQRLSQHNWQLWSSSPISIYVGRFVHNLPIEIIEVQRRIVVAEGILLYAHSPGFNTSNLNTTGSRNHEIRVINWGMRKSLFPEVSINRWESDMTVGHRAPKEFHPFSFK